MTARTAADNPEREQQELEEARRKYREERDKRLRAATSGFLELTGELAGYLEDPYTPAQPRASVDDEVDALVVGAGFGGLLAGARLREAGLERIRLVDTAGGVGGVWYWNRYPGAMCDVESYIYLPLLDQVGTIPEYKYSNAPVILDHANAIAEKYNLNEASLFHTSVTRIEWDEVRLRWNVGTDRGDRISARFVVFAIGSLSHPRLPDIPGIQTFAGPAFHTSRWDYSVTGGDSDHDPTLLRDKVVGIIGTGATAIQCVPPLGRASKHLYVFQRTPSTVAPRNNKKTDPEWAKSLTGQWQIPRMMNFLNFIDPAGHADVDLVDDAWTELYRQLNLTDERERLAGEARAAAAERADFEWMERIRGRVAEVVQDKETAESLKPWYKYFCKRPGFHDEYLAAFNLPTVSLVDTRGKGVEEVYDGGVVANGRRYPIDVLIFATGFDAGQTSADKFGCDVIGKGGRSLQEKWSSGLRTFHGVMTEGFPNMFFMSAPASQGSRSPNFMHMLVEDSVHFGYIVSQTLRSEAAAVEVTSEGEAAWVNLIISRAADRRAFLEACTPGRANNNGHVDTIPPEHADFGGGVLAFLDVMDGWRRSGDMEGLRLVSSAAGGDDDRQ